MKNLPKVLFFDLEVDPKSNEILEYGAMLNGQQIRGTKKTTLEQLAIEADTLCGHNIIAHDLQVLRKWNLAPSIFEKPQIDTLFLSVLLFPKKPYHHLVKDYQLNGTEINNPVADAVLTRQLLGDLLNAYHKLSKPLQTIYHSLLKEKKGFNGFFNYIPKQELSTITQSDQLVAFIKKYFFELFCGDAQLQDYIVNKPIELAFALAIITVDDTVSLLPPWIKHQFPDTMSVIDELRVACPGNKGCPYCEKLSPVRGLKKYFGFEAFRRFDGDGSKALQEQVVEAALANKSLLAIFPTGGGKSLTFQLPALMKGAANRSLTVIISPLQSLMKDQVDVLRKRHGNTDAETINGMLSPLERSEAIERVANGGANLLYISPESLRSRTILRLFTKRIINRFVIDEAHCFSSWGQDFRVDYLFIGKFLQKLQELKNLQQPIPISCFTATAKPAVVKDICRYFRRYLGTDLEVFQTSAKRKNLQYSVIKVEDEEAKYEKLRDLLYEEEGPKIVYVSRVKRSEELATQLQREGFAARAYNGKMERDVRIQVQEDFMSEESELEIIVATSAFGMGVDKDNVKMVVHYNISDSLENYMQESGRAGRRPDLQAKCYVLFAEGDLDAHFNLLNITKLSHKEVFQIYQGIKVFKKKRFTKSAREIAEKAGWDEEMMDLETRVKVAISALEETGYVKREENAPRIFAQSILVKNVEEAQEKMKMRESRFNGEQELQNAKRIFGSIISKARRNKNSEIHNLVETLGIEKHEVISIINIFKEIGILGNEKDLTAYYFTVQGKRNSLKVFERVSKIEKLLDLFPCK